MPLVIGLSEIMRGANGVEIGHLNGVQCVFLRYGFRARALLQSHLESPSNHDLRQFFFFDVDVDHHSSLRSGSPAERVQ